MELKLIKKAEVPEGARVTPSAMMPKIFCCIEGTRAKVFVNHKCVRRFIYMENGLKKMEKLRFMEEQKAYRIYSSISKKGPIIMHNRVS